MPNSGGSQTGRLGTADGTADERTVAARIERVLRPFLAAVEPGDPLPAALPLRELGLNSVNAIELVLGLEEEFGFEIPDAELGRGLFNSFSALTAAVCRFVGQGAP